MDMAQECADTELVAYLFARRARRAATGPDQDRVLGLAGVATQTGGPPHVAAFAAVQRAHGHAIAGDERGWRPGFVLHHAVPMGAGGRGLAAAEPAADRRRLLGAGAS
jgi:hypothetical protein